MSLTPVNECTGKGYRLEDLKLGEGLTSPHQGNSKLVYSFFWVIPRRLNFIYRHFGTHCPIFVGRLSKNNNWEEMVGVFIHGKVWLKKKSVGSPADFPTLLLSQTFTCINTPAISSQLLFLPKRPTKMEQSIPKRRHREFRRRGVTQKKEYSINL